MVNSDIEVRNKRDRTSVYIQSQRLQEDNERNITHCESLIIQTPTDISQDYDNDYYL